MVVRISKGQFQRERTVEVERLNADSEQELRSVLGAMPGLVHYYVGIDREVGTITNVSLWDSLEHARGLDGLPEMLALRTRGGGAGREVRDHHRP
jgi:hypothetical protein